MPSNAVARLSKLCLFLFISLLSLSGFAKTDFNLSPQSKIKDWTLMIYMDGDNDLEPFALQDLNEIEEGLNGVDNVNVLVLVDRAKGYDQSEGDWQDARLYLMSADKQPKKVSSKILSQPGELNMGDPELLKDFVQQSITAYPANKYALVMWNHGGGWANQAQDYLAPGKPKNFDELNLPELRQALSEGLKASELRQLDFIGFDMCLMAQMETAYELEGLAKVMIGSEAIEPGDGWPYHQLLPLFKNSTKGSRRIAREIVKQYGKFYEGKETFVATQSAFDLSKVSHAKKSLDAVARDMQRGMGKHWNSVARSFYYADNFNRGTSVKASKAVLSSVDMLDMFKRLNVAAPGLIKKRNLAALMESMDDLILANYTSPRHKYSNGIAVYAPVIRAQVNPHYQQTRFAQQSIWFEMLKALHSKQQQKLSAPKIEYFGFVGEDRQQQITEIAPGVLGLANFQVDIQGDNVLWVDSIAGYYDRKNKGIQVVSKGPFLDARYAAEVKQANSTAHLLMPEFKGRKNTMVQEWLGAGYYVTDGRDKALATFDFSGLNNKSIRVPVQFKRQGYEVMGGDLYFDPASLAPRSLLVEVPMPNGQLSYRQITPEANDQITLLFEFYGDGANEMSYTKGKTFNWGKGLELLVGLVEPGEVVFGARAVSLGGLSDVVWRKINVRGLEHSFPKDMVDSAKQLSLSMLEGKWQVKALNAQPNLHWQDTPLLAEFTVNPKHKDVYNGAIYNAGNPKEQLMPESSCYLDSRLQLPVLNCLSKQADGSLGNVFYMVFSAGKTEDGRLMFGAKPLVSGIPALRFEKIQGSQAVVANNSSQGASSAAANQQGGQASSSVPAPVSLAGIWQSSDGYSIGLMMNQYQFEFYEYGNLSDAGTYQIQGNRLTVQSQATGQTLVYQFQTDGQALILQGNGQSMHLIRSYQ